MNELTPFSTFSSILAENEPQAAAWIQGKEVYKTISGIARFYSTPYGGVLIDVEVFGLPDDSTKDDSAFYGMHVHEFGDCSDDFMKTGSHYNPSGAAHPFHAGDLPSLLSTRGYAWLSCYDKRFPLDDIIGKSVVIHRNRDDFTTQPAGDSGEKIACGVIRRIH